MLAFDNSNYLWFELSGVSVFMCSKLLQEHLTHPANTMHVLTHALTHYQHVRNKHFTRIHGEKRKKALLSGFFSYLVAITNISKRLGRSTLLSSLPWTKSFHKKSRFLTHYKRYYFIGLPH